MSRPRTLVSGGTGFVGRFIAERLIADGHAVTVLGRTPPAEDFFGRPVRFIEGTLDPDQDRSAAFEGMDFFVHAAFDHIPGKYRGGEGGDPDGFWRRNHDGSMALFEAARHAGVTRAIFLSSRAVYGVQASGISLAEDMPCFPETLYGRAKLATEEALRRLAGSGFVTVSLRVTGVYGPAGVGPAHKWASLIEGYLNGQVIERRVGSEVHGSDVAAAVALALGAPASGVFGETFNVSDIVVDRRDILAIVKERTLSQHALPEAADASGLNVMATDRLRALGWNPGGWALFRETVQEMLAERS